MKVERYQCDVCGRVKGEVNKWLRVSDALHGEFHVYYWNSLRGGDDALHICSAECLLKKLQSFLDRNV